MQNNTKWWKRKKKEKRDRGDVLINASTAVSAVRWSSAMLLADLGEIPDGWVLQGLYWGTILSGLAMGIVETYGVIYMYQGLKSYQMKLKNGKLNPKWMIIAFFAIGTTILTPLVIGPYLESRIVEGGMRAVLNTPMRLKIWTYEVAAAPVFIMAGVGFAQRAVKKPATKAETTTEEVDGNLTNVDGNLTATRKTWPQLSDKEKAGAQHMSRAELMEKYLVSDSTAGNFRSRSKQEFSEDE